MAVTQIRPGWCDLLGDGLGEGDRVREWLGDGDGLCDGDWEALGLLLADGLGLWLAVGAAVESVGLADELEVSLGEGLADGDVVTAPPSKTAEVTASVAPPQGELCGRAAAANAGAIATLDATKDPAAALTTTRPARMTPARTTKLRSSSRHIPYIDVLTRPADYPTLSIGNSRSVGTGPYLPSISSLLIFLKRLSLAQSGSGP